jgi:1,4-dihydroxy-6-naphthoate synthase
LLIAREPISANDPAMAQKRVLLPGRMTTANLLFSYAYPEVTQKTYRVFSEIEAALLNGEADLGVIIHENRFTYAQRGLHLVNDLGTYWETKTACAIPLGCIAIKRSLGETEAQLATEAIQESLDQAWKQMPRISAYVREHAQAMNPSVLLQHIELYVNDHTRALTPSDLQAIETLYQVYCRIEGIKPTESGSFF